MLSLMSVPHNPILQFYALEILKMLGVVRHTYKIIGRCSCRERSRLPSYLNDFLIELTLCPERFYKFIVAHAVVSPDAIELAGRDFLPIARVFQRLSQHRYEI